MNNNQIKHMVKVAGPWGQLWCYLCISTVKDMKLWNKELEKISAGIQ